MLRTLRNLSLTYWIFIGMGAGILFGWLAPSMAVELKPLSTVFLRMIKSVVVPIIFGTLVIGIAGHGDDLKRIGRLAVKSIGYFWLMTSIALAIGLLAVNITKPGDRRGPPPTRSQRADSAAGAHHVQRVPRAHRSPELLRGGHQQRSAPGGLLGHALRDRAHAGAGQAQGGDARILRRPGRDDVQVRGHRDEIRADRHRRGDGRDGESQRDPGAPESGLLVGTLYGALVVFALVALLPVALLARIPLRQFIQAVKDPAIIAFTTTSSDAALPLAMQRMTEFGVPRRIVAFVMPTGYSFNLDGSTLYLGVASIFVAQAAGVTSHGRTAAGHDADAAHHQ